jgi:hypothetical protein
MKFKYNLLYNFKHNVDIIWVLNIDKLFLFWKLWQEEYIHLSFDLHMQISNTFFKKRKKKNQIKQILC